MVIIFMLTIVFSILPFLRTNCENITTTKIEESKNSFEYDEYLVDDEISIFPKSIPIFKVRKDFYTKKTVTRGQLTTIFKDFIKDDNNNAKKVSLKNFRKTLQCSPVEPDLDILGVMTLLKLTRPTKAGLLAASANFDFDCQPYYKCKEIYEELLNNKKSRTCSGKICPLDMLIIRVINSELYYDWPWPQDRIQNRHDYSHMKSFSYLLSMVNDIPDSVFFTGAQQSYTYRNLAMPALCNSPSFKSSEIAYPWLEAFMSELLLYRKIIKTDGNFSENNIRKSYGALGTNMPMKYVPWHLKKPKAAAYASLLPGRQMFYDLAALRPDLIDGTSPNNPNFKAEGWNPNCQDAKFNPNSYSNFNCVDKSGGFGNLLSVQGSSKSYNTADYKYLVVMTGGSSDKYQATTGKLASFLSHSGAVIIIQKSDFQYHFSARLKPWVHYVPLSYSMAELPTIIEFLIKHDHLAKRIAANAKAFGESYLRLEDYFCYDAAILEALGNIMNGSDILQPFNPGKIPKHMFHRRLI